MAERAESLGVTILRDHAVTAITAQDDHGVTVKAGKGKTFRGRWLATPRIVSLNLQAS
ncbi:pentachlorophenol 4- [Lasallia pustulata]|uniref:Pentachlorophenol 4 n=1 Tax=Lasallia pustulata TaxID=136370 RepID=A0A1W5D6L5_9LECA|nr:pentachlorophenol 4- [Lasallia pustulata]